MSDEEPCLIYFQGTNYRNLIPSYILLTCLYLAIVVFAPSLALAQVTGLQVTTIIIITIIVIVIVIIMILAQVTGLQVTM